MIKLVKLKGLIRKPKEKQAPGTGREVEVGFPRKPQNLLQWVHSQPTFNHYSNNEVWYDSSPLLTHYLAAIKLLRVLPPFYYIILRNLARALTRCVACWKGRGINSLGSLKVGNFGKVGLWEWASYWINRIAYLGEKCIQLGPGKILPFSWGRETFSHKA